MVLPIALHGAPAGSQEAVPNAVASLDAHMHTVIANGYWWNDDAEGFFRAVVIAEGVEHVDNALYLQWVKTDPDKNTYAVAASVAVVEVNAAAVSRLIDVSHEDSEFGTFQMTVIVKRERSNELRFRLSADGTVGVYKIERLK